jgi:hypothetical protein
MEKIVMSRSGRNRRTPDASDGKRQHEFVRVRGAREHNLKNAGAAALP